MSPSEVTSGAHNGGTSGTFSAFRDSANGTPPPIGSSPFADLQTAPCWLEISHDGQFLFTVNTGSGTISRYSIAPGGALAVHGGNLTELASSPTSLPAGAAPAGIVRQLAHSPGETRSRGVTPPAPVVRGACGGHSRQRQEAVVAAIVPGAAPAAAACRPDDTARLLFPRASG